MWLMVLAKRVQLVCKRKIKKAQPTFANNSRSGPLNGTARTCDEGFRISRS